MSQQTLTCEDQFTSTHWSPRLLNLIGHAEFEKEIQRTVGKIMEDKPDIESATYTDTNWMKKSLKDI